MARLFFASFVTVGLLLGMVCGVVLAALVYTDNVNLGSRHHPHHHHQRVIWLISPWISDLSLRWFNKLDFLDDAEVKPRFPGVHHSCMRWPTSIASGRRGSALSPTATRPPSPTACCAPTRASSSPTASSSS